MNRLLNRIPDGIACAAGTTDQGWYAAVLVQPDRDLAFREPMNSVWNDAPDSLKPGICLNDWAEAAATPSERQIVLVTSDDEDGTGEVLAQASGLRAPATSQGNSAAPLVAWLRDDDDGCEAYVHRNGETQCAWKTPTHCRYLDIAELAGQVVLACQVSESNGPTIRVWSEDGRVLLETPGRNPCLAAGADSLYILHEEPFTNGCRLVLSVLNSAGDNVRRVPVPSGNDLNLHASLMVDPKTDTLFIAHEAAPMWGDDEQLGRHRDICLWRVDPQAAAVKPAPHTANGRLPIPHRAFREHAEKNATPLTPQVRFIDGRLCVCFRQFRQHGIKSFGWDIQRLTLGERGWSDPERVSENFGAPDTPYDIVSADGASIVFQPAFDQIPCTRVNVDAPAGFMWTEYHELLSGHPARPYDMRVEIRACDLDKSLPDVTVLQGMTARYGIPPAVHDLGTEPPPLPSSSRPQHLVWGDLHVHSAYSKCIAPMDGMAEEKLRFQRDHLGCRVLCLTEHTHLMNSCEVDHAYDMLEAEAGADCVPLHASEPLVTGQDTIYFAKDRETFERLRVILQRNHTRCGQYQAIKAMFSKKDVLVVRHFDGPGGGHPDFRPESFDPELEGAMEAMQVRGDSLMGKLVCGDAHTKSKDTAARFLDAGQQVGLIAGTDHCGGYGRNHACLTGFWIDELSPEAVWEALWNRKTIAVSKGKIAIWAECGTARMGDTAEVSREVRIQAWMSSPRTLRRVCLLRDGNPLPWQDISGRTAEIELVDDNVAPGDHWYSVTVEGTSQFHGQSVLAHTSPIFVHVNDGSTGQ